MIRFLQIFCVMTIVACGVDQAFAQTAAGATVPAGGSLAITGPDSVCKTINNGTGKTLFVPTNSVNDWQAFYNNTHLPAGVTVDVSLCGGAACGPANGVMVNFPGPTTGLCSPGTASTPTLTALQWNWTCTGSGIASCSAPGCGGYLYDNACWFMTAKTVDAATWHNCDQLCTGRGGADPKTCTLAGADNSICLAILQHFETVNFIWNGTGAATGLGCAIGYSGVNVTGRRDTTCLTSAWTHVNGARLCACLY